MADTVITAADLAGDLGYQQVAEQGYKSGSFVADDQAFHSMEVSVPANSGFLYGATNPSNKDMTMTLYGAFVSGLDPATSGAVFPIEVAGTTVTAGASAHAITTHKFPYYIIRCTFAATPDGSTVIVYASSLG